MLYSIVLMIMSTLLFQSEADFMSLFNQVIPKADCKKMARAFRRSMTGAPPKLEDEILIAGLVFHVCQSTGVLSHHIHQLTGKRHSDSAISERRQTMDWPLWMALINKHCGPLAQKHKHPGAFYKGLRLVGIDGTTWNVANTPQVKTTARKTKSRRKTAAFHRLSGAVLYELGIHNPIAASLGVTGESELALAANLWPLLQKDWLVIGDRYYGVGKVAGIINRLENKPAALLRVRKNLKAHVIELLCDGSALITVIDSNSGEKLVLREIRASVRRRSGQWVRIRLWTNLLDPKTYPARELINLYAMRWEQEIAFKELKIDLKRDSILLSHTLCTAAQEVAALLIAQTLIVRARLSAADFGSVPVLNISFTKTHQVFLNVWAVTAIIGDLLSPRIVNTFLHRLLHTLAVQQSPPRRPRSCPRAVRQPIGSWPRLIRNTSASGHFAYKINKIKA
jgi:hypothetical protein